MDAHSTTFAQLTREAEEALSALDEALAECAKPLPGIESIGGEEADEEVTAIEMAAA